MNQYVMATRWYLAQVLPFLKPGRYEKFICEMSDDISQDGPDFSFYPADKPLKKTRVLFCQVPKTITRNPAYVDRIQLKRGPWKLTFDIFQSSTISLTYWHDEKAKYPVIEWHWCYYSFNKQGRYTDTHKGRLSLMSICFGRDVSATYYKEYYNKDCWNITGQHEFFSQLPALPFAPGIKIFGRGIPLNIDYDRVAAKILRTSQLREFVAAVNPPPIFDQADLLVSMPAQSLSKLYGPDGVALETRVFIRGYATPENQVPISFQDYRQAAAALSG
ncbi:MAG: hypothetical protein NTZ49_00580 [Candidatus Parcubacteria bacterium]|nr:hypothetical protein [Candidatus Parcubacteria bacterium]